MKDEYENKLWNNLVKTLVTVILIVIINNYSYIIISIKIYYVLYSSKYREVSVY